jgi:hypothetical protein
MDVKSLAQGTAKDAGLQDVAVTTLKKTARASTIKLTSKNSETTTVLALLPP